MKEPTKEEGFLVKFLDLMWNDFERVIEAGAVSYQAHGRHKKAERTTADLEKYRMAYRAIRNLIKNYRGTKRETKP